jgi:hypothetical protein
MAVIVLSWLSIFSGISRWSKSESILFAALIVPGKSERTATRAIAALKVFFIEFSVNKPGLSLLEKMPQFLVLFIPIVYQIG